MRRNLAKSIQNLSKYKIRFSVPEVSRVSEV
jgi:hypothetical protein